jgi:hypothetical protein
MEQPPNQLRKSQVDSPNKRKECHSGAFMYTPGEIILYILDLLEYFDGANVLKQVNKHLHEIIEPEWPPIPQDLFNFWLLNTKVKCTLKRDLYQFCMRLNKEKAIHNYDPNNHNMKQARYLAAIMSHSLSRYQTKPSVMSDSLSHHQTDPSQWNVIMLKDEKCDIAFNLSWNLYFKSCLSLVYLTLDNASHIHLNLKHTRLEGLFLGYTASVDPPSSMKIFVLYTSKEKYQKHETQLSLPTQFLVLNAPECSLLKLW